ncbi:MAG: hypothetical protein HQL95_00225 [Magnetococcales bacterium]|nr:hypothetical protein [Magnetococcales bacterium]
MNPGELSNTQRGSRQRDAIRLLFVLKAGCEPLLHEDESGASHIFRGEARLHAMDFWVRYPDYLADELLDLYEQKHDASLIEQVRRIFTEDEPDLRRIPMMRWRWGAFDRIDTAIAHLAVSKLIKLRKRQSGKKTIENEFLLFPDAISLVDRIPKEFPVLSWYDRRTRLVAWLAGDQGGNDLKQQQHKRIEYHATPMGQSIPPIKDQVWARFRKLTEAAA